MLRWARERASLGPAELARRVGLKEDRVRQWESTGQLPLNQLERLAAKTHTPVGYLFLPEPPREALPIPDFRTLDGARVERPSVDLLDTIYQCQQRQSWYREFLVAEAEPPLPFIGSFSQNAGPAAVAANIRQILGFNSGIRAAAASWEEALRALIDLAETERILVMRNGVVGNNTHRKLSVQEFRGFALADSYAPLVFINAADARAAQMFTLVHEIAHLWLGESGVSDTNPHSAEASERFCNAVAAEVLVPADEFRQLWDESAERLAEALRLARHFKVSTLVVLIRALELSLLTRDEFTELYAGERERSPGAVSGGGGGNFYNTQRSRLGDRFSRAVIGSAIEGRTSYGEAYQLLGVKSRGTFEQLARALKVVA